MYIDSIISGYKMVEVPPDIGLRAELENRSFEELVEILSTYKNLHNSTDTDSKKRIIRAIEIEHHNSDIRRQHSGFPKISSLIVGVLFDRETRRKRISDRLEHRLDAGMIDEVKNLINIGVNPETLIYYGLEYKYITLYLTGKLSYEAMVTDLEIAIHQFAKRQMTWFRGMERRGIKINWVDGNLPIEVTMNKIMELLVVPDK